MLLICTGDSNEHVNSVNMESLVSRTVHAVTMWPVNILVTCSTDHMHTIKGMYIISPWQCRQTTLIAPAYLE